MMVRGAADRGREADGPGAARRYSRRYANASCRTDNFTTKPKGFDGLTIVVKDHPRFNADCSSFVASCPFEGSAAWAASRLGQLLPRRGNRSRIPGPARELGRAERQTAPKRPPSGLAAAAERAMGTSGLLAARPADSSPSWVDDARDPRSLRDLPRATPRCRPGARRRRDAVATRHTSCGAATLQPRAPDTRSAAVSAARAAISRASPAPAAASALRQRAVQTMSAWHGRRAASDAPDGCVADGRARRARGLPWISNALGAAATLRQLNLAGLAGRPAADVFVALTEVVCPPGGAVDEAHRAQAMLETVGDMAEAGVGKLETLTPAQMQEFFLDFIAHSIEGRLLPTSAREASRCPTDLAAIESSQTQLPRFRHGRTRDSLSGRLRRRRAPLRSRDRRRSLIRSTRRPGSCVAAAGEPENETSQHHRAARTGDKVAVRRAQRLTPAHRD